MREGDDVFARAPVMPVMPVMPVVPGAPAPAAPDHAAQVRVNGDRHSWRTGLTVADVLAERGDDPLSVATAVNTRFVPRGARAETSLWPDDRLVVFSAIVGG